MYYLYKACIVSSFLAGILMVGCVYKSTDTDSELQIFKNGSAFDYKGHYVKKYIKKYPDGKIASQYFAFQNESGELVKHGLQTAYFDNGNKAAEMLFLEGIGDGNCIFWDENGELITRGVYKEGLPWDGTFILPHFEHSIFTFKNGKNIAFEENGKIYAQGEWKDENKWDGSFYNIEKGSIEYFEKGKLIRTEENEDIIKKWETAP